MACARSQVCPSVNEQLERFVYDGDPFVVTTDALLKVVISAKALAVVKTEKQRNTRTIKK